MKISIYSTAFNVIKNNFDFKEAIQNWILHADEVCIAVNTSQDGSLEAIRSYVAENKLEKVRVIETNHSYDDPFCYGKIENSALQACTGDLMVQQNLDERISFDRQVMEKYYKFLYADQYQAIFVPVINLYGDVNHYIDINRKWYIHRKGLFRGPVNFGLKPDGRPDYNKTSTDELINSKGELVLTYDITTRFHNNPQQYVASGQPIIYHLGYVNFNDRIERNKFWIEFWEKATGGDKNNHATSVEELASRMKKPHNLPLWRSHE